LFSNFVNQSLIVISLLFSKSNGFFIFLDFQQQVFRIFRSVPGEIREFQPSIDNRFNPDYSITLFGSRKYRFLFLKFVDQLFTESADYISG